MSGRDGAADARDHPSVDRGLEESRPWPTVGLPPARWTDTRLQAHHAVQLLASFAGEFLEPREDDGHRSLCWVPEHSVLATGSAVYMWWM